MLSNGSFPWEDEVDVSEHGKCASVVASFIPLGENEVFTAGNGVPSDLGRA